MREDGAVEADGAAVDRHGPKEEVATDSAAGVGRCEVACVGVDVEDHVGGVITDDGLWVGGHVIQEGIDPFHCLLGGLRLLCCDFI